LLVHSSAKRRVTFGRHQKADVRLVACRQDRQGLELVINSESRRLPVFGVANGLNAAAACAMAAELGVEVPEALAGMAAASLSPHRSRLVECAGRVILDDCYNANPASMLTALESLAELPVPGRRIAVLGSMAELGHAADRGHAQVIERAHELTVDGLVPVGEAMIEAAERYWPRDDEWRRAPVQPAALGRYLAEHSAVGDALLFKASRSVGLEAVLDVMLAELECNALGGV
jgi:UDP-N-acetylmuramyl pentapeptide synthase